MSRQYFRWVDKPKQRGGKRAGAGRKPIDEKAAAVTIYIYPSIIEAIGGKAAVQDVMKQAVLSKYKKKK